MRLKKMILSLLLFIPISIFADIEPSKIKCSDLENMPLCEKSIVYATVAGYILGKSAEHDQKSYYDENHFTDIHQKLRQLCHENPKAKISDIAEIYYDANKRKMLMKK